MTQIKRDWERALIEAGIDVPLGRRQFNIVCPFHHDNTPSLSINLDSGVWICHANPEECGKGKISTLISKFLVTTVESVGLLVTTGESVGLCSQREEQLPH